MISDEDRVVLESWARSRAIRASHVERARIVLAVADGNGTASTARLVGVSRPTVTKWRDRFAEHGLAGLDDEARAGRPKTIDDASIIAATLPPQALAVTHWSSRLLGRHLGIGDATVARAWRKYRVQPWRQETLRSPPIRSWKPRLATWSGFTSIRVVRRSLVDAYLGRAGDRRHPLPL